MIELTKKILHLLIPSIFILILVGTIIRLTHSGLSCPDWPLCYGLWILLPSKIQIIQEEIPYTYSQIIYEWGHRIYAGSIIGPLFIMYYLCALILFKKEPYFIIQVNLLLVLLLTQIILGGLTVYESNINWSVALHLFFALLIYNIAINNILYIYKNKSYESLHINKSRCDYIVLYFLFVNAIIGALISSSGIKALTLTSLNQFEPYSIIVFLHVIFSVVTYIIIGMIYISIKKKKLPYNYIYLKLLKLILILYTLQLAIGFLSYIEDPSFFIGFFHQLLFLLIFTFFSIYYWHRRYHYKLKCF